MLLLYEDPIITSNERCKRVIAHKIRTKIGPEFMSKDNVIQLLGS